MRWGEVWVVFMFILEKQRLSMYFILNFFKNKHHCIIKIMKTVRILRVESFKRAE